MFWYHFGDIFFVIFHTSLIIFNLFAWIWKKTRLANLITLLLTGASWFILGIWYGIGYCPLTDWHFQILDKLGKQHPYSYTKYLFDRITGLNFNANFIDYATAACFFIALLLSIYINLRKKK
jgi:hypothetical protein